MDAADRAQDHQDAELANKLDAAVAAARSELDKPGNALCADCHEEIPLERRLALPSAHRCVNCQAFAERIAKIPNHA